MSVTDPVHTPAERYARLEKIAALYIECLDNGLVVLKTMGTLMGVDETQVRTAVVAARRAGLLGLEPHLPVRVHTGQGSVRPDGWAACRECKYPWPCAGYRKLFKHKRAEDERRAQRWAS